MSRWETAGVAMLAFLSLFNFVESLIARWRDQQLDERIDQLTPSTKPRVITTVTGVPRSSLVDGSPSEDTE